MSNVGVSENLNDKEELLVKELSESLREPERNLQRNDKRRNAARKITVVSALLLGLLALFNCYGAVRLAGKLDLIYLVFALTGLIGSILGLLNLNVTRPLLLIFFLAQSVFIYGESFRIKLSPGLALPVSRFEGNIQEAMINPIGFSINLIGVTLFILCWYSVKPQRRSP